MKLAATLIAWFLDGEKPNKAAPEKPAKWLRKRYRQDVAIEGLEFAGTDGERIWTIADLLNDANRALDALATAPDHEEDKYQSSIYMLTKKDWADLRLFGPYLPHRGAMGYLDRFDICYGLPDFVFIGMDRSTIAKRKQPDYVFLECRRLSRLPDFYEPVSNALGYYEIGYVGRFKNRPSTELLGIRFFFAALPDGSFCWLSRLVRDQRAVITQRHSGSRPLRPSKRRTVHVPGPPRLVQDKMTNDNGEDMLEIIPLAFTLYQHIEANWIVSCSDHRGTVNMSITPAEAKYLFRTRLTAIATDGRRKRIIHWVRAHKRTHSGRGTNESNVKTHLRGERHFKWHGMDVAITLPGLHTSRPTEVHAQVYDTFVKVPDIYRRAGLSKLWLRLRRAKQKRKDDAEAKKHGFIVTNPYTKEQVPMIDIGKHGGN